MSFLSGLGNVVKGIGGLAENLVEGLTGSEALGDIAKIATNMMTGNVLGVGEGVFDIAKNVGAGASKLASGVWNAAKDAVKEFSNPGGLKPPAAHKHKKLKGYAGLKAENKKQQNQINNLMKQVKALEAKVGGGSTGGVSGPGQVGSGGGITGPGQTGSTGGTEGSSGAPYTPGASTPIKMNTGGDPELDSIINGPGSFETKILMLLMAMAKKKKMAMADQLGKATEAGKESAKYAGSDDKGDIKKQAEASHDQTTATSLMQQYANDLSQLTTLATNMQKLFHDSKMATIQNIR
jgi:hypothetical protein